MGKIKAMFEEICVSPNNEDQEEFFDLDEEFPPWDVGDDLGFPELDDTEEDSHNDQEDSSNT